MPRSEPDKQAADGVAVGFAMVSAVFCKGATAQAILIGLALIITLLRCYVRIRIEGRALTVSDYFIWAGWFCSLGWVICCVKTLAIQIDHPLTEEGWSDSVTYLKTVFAASFLFDMGLYMPKASIIAFYWWLIPVGFRRLRIGLYIGTTFMVCAGIASLFMDALLCIPVTDNWSLENQLNSVWNNPIALTANWVLNFSTDILLFVLPFFMISCLKLRKRQKFGLCGIFSLGALTMIISLIRFVEYTSNLNLEDTVGDTWCTAEMATAVIVASLPGLKNLIMRKETPTNSSYVRNTHGYLQTGSGHPSNHVAEIRGGEWDDELELTFLDRKPSPSSMGTDAKDQQDGVMVTKNVTVTHHVL